MKRILVTAGFAACFAVHASTVIKIGQTADFSSVAAAQMKDFNAGANAAFAAVNANGGIRGQTIKLVKLDDALNAEKAAANARFLINEESVVALFGSRGTDPSEAVMKVAEASRIPLIAPITGADTVRNSRYTFPVRASYRTEIEGILKHLSISATKLAVLVQDDKFGNPLSAMIDELTKKTATVQIVGKVKFARKETNLRGHTQAILKFAPTAVIALCNPASCQAFTKEVLLQTTNSGVARPTIYQTSIADIYADFAKLGASAVQGNAFAQVFPDPNRAYSQLNKSYKTAMSQANAMNINYRSFEGYISARVLIEALKRSRGATPAALMDAMEGMDTLDLGGLRLRYSSSAHEGSNFFDLVTMDKAGRLVH